MKLLRELSTHLLIAIVFALLLVLTACQSGTKPDGKTKPDAVAPIGAAGKAQDEAQAKADKAKAEKLAMAAANVQRIIETNAKTADTPQKVTIDTEAKLAKGNIGEEPDPVELAKSAERERLQAEGKAAEAQRVADESRKRAEGLSAAEAKAVAERDAAILARDKAINDAAEALRLANAAALKAWKEQEAKHSAEVAELQRKIEAAEIGMLTWIIGGIGGLCLLGAVAVVVLAVNSPLGLNAKTWKTAAALVACSGGCFAAVRFINHPWIPHATGGVIVLIAGWAAWQVVADARARKAAHVATAESATKYKELSATLVKGVEEFKKSAPEMREQVKATMFNTLTTDHDLMVDELKLEAAKNKAA